MVLVHVLFFIHTEPLHPADFYFLEKLLLLLGNIDVSIFKRVYFDVNVNTVTEISFKFCKQVADLINLFERNLEDELLVS